MSQDFTTFKVVLIGDGAVGKTSLIKRYVHGKFEAQYLMTIGFEPYTRYETLDETKICFSLWDIAGSDQFKTMRKMFFAGAAASVITFDLTRRESFENTAKWANDARAEEPNQLLLLVGNKSDLPDRQVTTEEGEQQAQVLNCIAYIETSALNGDHVIDAFIKLGRQLLEQHG